MTITLGALEVGRFGRGRQHEVAIPFREAVLKWERLGTIRIAPQNAVAYDYNEETHEGTGAQWKRN